MARQPEAAPRASPRPMSIGAVRAEPPLAPTEPVKGRYVYCIVRSDQPLTFGSIGIGEEPAPVYTVRVR